MIDAEISFSHQGMALSAREARMTPLLGLGFAVLVSTGLWGLLALGVAYLL